MKNSIGLYVRLTRISSRILYKNIATTITHSQQCIGLIALESQLRKAIFNIGIDETKLNRLSTILTNLESFVERQTGSPSPIQPDSYPVINKIIQQLVGTNWNGEIATDAGNKLTLYTSKHLLRLATLFLNLKLAEIDRKPSCGLRCIQALTSLTEYIEATDGDTSMLSNVAAITFKLPSQSELSLESLKTKLKSEIDKFNLSRNESINQTLNLVLTDGIGGHISSSTVERICNSPLGFDYPHTELKEKLNSLFGAIFPNRSDQSPQDHWIAIVVHCLTASVSVEALSLMISTGCSGSELDQKLELIQSPSLKDILKSVILTLRMKQQTVVANDAARWLAAEERIGEAIDALNKTPELSEQSLSSASTTLTEYLESLSSTCSVGADLKALEVVYKLSTAGSIKSTSLPECKLKLELTGKIQNRLIAILQSILEPMWSSDVHHINHLMKLIFTDSGLEISRLRDGYRPAMKDKMNRHRNSLITRYLQADWIFEAIADIRHDGVHFTTVSDAISDLSNCISPVSKKGFSLKPETRLAMIEKSLHYDHSLLLSSPNLAEINTAIGGHGLVGLAAKSGNFNAFSKLSTSLNQLHFNEIEFHNGDGILKRSLTIGGAHRDKVYESDSYGYTLFDYAVLGGNISILNLIVKYSAPSELQSFIDQSANRNTVPTVMALAAESGNPNMVVSIKTLCSADALVMMAQAQDNRGYTTLMHAACCGNPDVIEHLPDIFKSASALSQKNNDGQDVIILASTVAKSVLTTQKLLAMRSRDEFNCKSFYPALMDGNVDIIKAFFDSGHRVVTPKVLSMIPNGDIARLFANLADDSFHSWDRGDWPLGWRQLLYNRPQVAITLLERMPKKRAYILGNTRKDDWSLLFHLAQNNPQALVSLVATLDSDDFKSLLSSDRSGVTLTECAVAGHLKILADVMFQTSSENKTSIIDAILSHHNSTTQNPYIFQLVESDPHHMKTILIEASRNDQFRCLDAVARPLCITMAEALYSSSPVDFKKVVSVSQLKYQWLANKHPRFANIASAIYDQDPNFICELVLFEPNGNVRRGLLKMPIQRTGGRQLSLGELLATDEPDRTGQMLDKFGTDDLCGLFFENGFGNPIIKTLAQKKPLSVINCLKRIAEARYLELSIFRGFQNIKPTVLRLIESDSDAMYEIYSVILADKNLHLEIQSSIAFKLMTISPEFTKVFLTQHTINMKPSLNYLIEKNSKLVDRILNCDVIQPIRDEILTYPIVGESTQKPIDTQTACCVVS